MYKSIIIILALINYANIVHAKESLYTSYYDGNAPISIDGNLDDWDFIELPLTNITITNDWTMMPAPNNDADLSARFNCFIDNSFLYVGVEVNDDVLVFGQESFEFSWNDDAVDLKLDGDLIDIEKGYFDANDFQVRVSLDETGQTTLEGMVPFVEELQIPTLWEKAGVQAILLPGEKAYTAEIAIPLYLLGYTTGADISSIGMNIQVYDDDDSGDFDHQLSWADDPDNTSWKSTETFNIIHFNKLSQISSSPIVQGQNSDITIVLNEPINSFSYGNIIESLEKIKNGNLEDAEVLIDGIDDSNSIIKGVLYKEIENGDKAYNYFNRVNDDPSSRIGRYIQTNKFGLSDDKISLYQEYIENNRELSSYELFQIRDIIILEKMKAGEKDIAAELIFEILHEKTYDPVTVEGWCSDLQMLGYKQEAFDYLSNYIYELNINENNRHFYLLKKRLSILLNKMGMYQEAIENLSQFSNDPVHGDDANLFISTVQFYLQNYEISRNLAGQVISNSQNATIILDAKMLLYSIELKQ